MVYKPKKSYEWSGADNGYSPSMDANIVGGVVEHLEETEGAVTRYNFLEFSTPEDSPTHSLFEWDDTVAAHKYRLKQSTIIISNLRIAYTNKRKESVLVRAFVNVSEPKQKPMYESVERALSDDRKREVILAKLQAELDSLVMRNKHITELADMLEKTAKKLRQQ